MTTPWTPRDRHVVALGLPPDAIDEAGQVAKRKALSPCAKLVNNSSTISLSSVSSPELQVRQTGVWWAAGWSSGLVTGWPSGLVGGRARGLVAGWVGGWVGGWLGELVAG